MPGRFALRFLEGRGVKFPRWPTPNIGRVLSESVPWLDKTGERMLKRMTISTPSSGSPSKTFGQLLRQLRELQALRIDELAERSELAVDVVEAFEADDREPELADLLALGHGLGMEVSAIFRVWEAAEAA